MVTTTGRRQRRWLRSSLRESRFCTHYTSHEVRLVIRDYFKEGVGIIPQLVEMDPWITDTQYWFTIHVCVSFLKSQKQSGEKPSFVWTEVTRYCGVLFCLNFKWKRFNEMNPLSVVTECGQQWSLLPWETFCWRSLSGSYQWRGGVGGYRSRRQNNGSSPSAVSLSDGQNPVMNKLYRFMYEN